MESESMKYDVVIVGAGPAGLAASIKLKQLNPELSVCILEKGAEVGSHLISGAVLNPESLKALLPDQYTEALLHTPVTHDAFYYLTAQKALKLPTPLQMKNEGNYIISVGELGRFLADVAQGLGVEIYPGFAASKILFGDNNEVIGVATGDMGIDKQGEKTPNYQPGMHLHAKITLFAEGCRGELSQKLMRHYHLRQGVQPQTYALGVKEIWRVDEKLHEQGKVIHTIGWPMDNKTYGGSFIYHLKDNQVALGFVVGLDYQNPYMSPFEEMQRFKTHPLVAPLLTGGERLSYGARALNEGGYQSIPKLTFPGGALVGDAAGFLNVPQIKGIHNAIESGMLAATAAIKQLEDTTPIELQNYAKAIQDSAMLQSLYKARNIRPGFKWGLVPGLINAALETYVFKGKTPWTLSHHTDHKSLINIKNIKPITYAKPDGKLTFDRLSSVYLTNTFHEENQPCHLKLKEKGPEISVNLKAFDSPETRYCPGQVYEIIDKETSPRLQINAQNCIHCKTCDIKDPTQNILWTAPEGGGGPNYQGM